jgi:hypothetical protein
MPPLTYGKLQQNRKFRSNSNMKKLIQASFLTLFATCASHAALLFELAPSTSAPTVGQVFSIDLRVSGNTTATQYLGFGLSYLFSNPGISLISASPGVDFEVVPDQVAPLFSAVSFPGVTAENFTLAQFSLTADAVGPVTFSVSSDPTDLAQGLLPFEGLIVDLSAAVTIDVQPGSEIPEPSTFAGSAAALCLGLYLLRR